MNKKAVSPLIATVLIIGFTVALAAIVMTWGGSFLRKTTEETEATTKAALRCATDLNFEISDVDCANNKVTIENKGTVDIKKLTFRIRKDTTAITATPTETSTAVNVFEVKSFTFTSTDISGATQVDAMATIAGEAGRGDIDCSQAVKEFMVSPACA